MSRYIIIFLYGLFGAMAATAQQASPDSCGRCIVLAEQQEHRIAIADADAGKIIWEWQPAHSNVSPEHVKWFSNPSDAKVVLNGRYVLTCASGGGVALVRMADRKTVFYAYAGGNTHSIELLPDGNIVAASSTGNYLTIFRTDTRHFPGNVYSKRVPIAFGHNVVWDKAQQLLWSAEKHQMKTFRYNFNRAQPDLELVDSLPLPGKEAHDLFPVYGLKELWLTNTTHVYRFTTDTRQLRQADVVLQENIKSVSSGPEGYPVIMILPKTSWWTDEVLDAGGKRIFYQPGLKIYKARWVLPNSFSYGH